MVAESAVQRAPNDETSPLAPSSTFSFLSMYLSARGSLRNWSPPRRTVSRTPPNRIRTMSRGTGISPISKDVPQTLSSIRLTTSVNLSNHAPSTAANNGNVLLISLTYRFPSFCLRDHPRPFRELTPSAPWDNPRASPDPASAVSRDSTKRTDSLQALTREKGTRSVNTAGAVLTDLGI